MKLNCQSMFSRHFKFSRLLISGPLLLMVIPFILAPSVVLASENTPSYGNHFSLYLQTVEATFNLGNPPQPGDQAIFSRDVFALDDSDPENPAPMGDVIGLNFVVCTLVGQAGFSCTGSVTLFGYGGLTIAGPFIFQNPPDVNAVSVTGGNGRFAGASGVMTAHEVNLIDQVYLVDLSSSKTQ